MQKRGMTGILTIMLLLGACAAPQERDPYGDVTLTEAYSRQLKPAAGNAEENSAADSEIAGQQRPWWEYYENKELNAYIEAALINGPSLKQARLRIEQAAAAAKTSFAELLPEATISGDRSTTNGDNESPSSFSLRGAASYELDIWGGQRASYRSDKLDARAAIEDYRTSAITLSASIVESWLRLMSLREEEALLRSQIETNDMVLDLQHKRYENGVAEALDVLQQLSVLERAKAQLPDILAEQELIEHQLSVLAGLNPSVEPELTGTAMPETLPLPEAGVPSQLLEERPDIRAAWLRLEASDWSSEAARINRLPSFDISANYSTNGAKFKHLFEIWMLDLALGFVMPIIDGGQRAAEQARQEAIADERFQVYRETVLSAIGEVEDAITQNHHQAQKIRAVEKQLDVARNALEQAQISYSNGNVGYISVLNELISTQSLEQQLVRERRSYALYRVALYRAMGLRTWTDELIQLTENTGG